MCLNDIYHHAILLMLTHLTIFTIMSFNLAPLSLCRRVSAVSSSSRADSGDEDSEDDEDSDYVSSQQNAKGKAKTQKAAKSGSNSKNSKTKERRMSRKTKAKADATMDDGEQEEGDDASEGGEAGDTSYGTLFLSLRQKNVNMESVVTDYLTRFRANPKRAKAELLIFLFELCGIQDPGIDIDKVDTRHLDLQDIVSDLTAHERASNLPWGGPRIRAKKTNFRK